VPSHRFLHSLLQSYGLELHHLTPSGILHMVAFVTLCKAYIGIEPHLNLQSHFFRAQLRQGLDVGVASLGSVDILVHSRPEADSYFSIPLLDPPIGWHKARFLLKNDTNAPLPMFTDGCPIPHPNWGHGVAQTDLHRLQPLLEIVQGLLHKGLTGEEILQTFFNQREATMRVSQGPSCLIRFSFTRLGGAEINTQVPEALVPEDSVRQEARHACSK
jgi:hypothetical protein